MNSRIAALVLLLCFTLADCAATVAATVIVLPEKASRLERLAAQEVRRYVYLRSGSVLPIIPKIAKGDAIVLSTNAAAFAESRDLSPQSFLLKTIATNGHSILYIIGSDDVGVLYGAYRVAELLGVRFYLHGDVLPDEQVPFSIPQLDERSKPLFALRGIQPFHDFPEGPDWWNADDYKAIEAQLAKMRMNFIGLHTYPEGHPIAEPTVWIGKPDDFKKNGDVTFSYPSSYANTLRKGWGYDRQAPARDFSFGAADLFEVDAYGSDPMLGHCPEPKSPTECNDVFNRTSHMLREAFDFAHELHIKTCVGTETPLTVPKAVAAHVAPRPPSIESLYLGIFQRAAKAYPLDYYWLWTPEHWTWQEVKPEQVTTTTNDLAVAYSAFKKASVPFQLATCGWVLGPPSDRAMFDKILSNDVAISCINRHVGNTPIDAGFKNITNHSKWAIPWLEDDGALTSPELWVSRMRRDAADALDYGCDGLMGIHWRTRVLSPNVSALQQAMWSQPWKVGTNRPCDDFYRDWAEHEFGSEVAEAAVTIFKQIDGHLPRPTDWTTGPGGLRPDTRPWEKVENEFWYVDAFATLAPKVAGKGNRERYEYWNHQFQYMKATAKLRCAWQDFNKAMERVRSATDPAAKTKLAREAALPSRELIVERLDSVYHHLLATVSTKGEMGVVANWEEHILPDLLLKPGAELEQLLGEKLPPESLPKKTYYGPLRVFVPTVCSIVNAGEKLQLKAIVLSQTPVATVVLKYREIGARNYKQTTLRNVARSIYTAHLPAMKNDLEYYIEATNGSEKSVFPATAPEIAQTVVVLR
ncbi:MAG: alpha-glucuronidase family glycosyl hydrolase [Limisphaerales bacterium]